MSTAEMIDIAVIGAGAAGLFTAIFAAQARPSRRVVAFDGAARLGAKILVAGGGRCNVTNVHVEPADYWGGSRAVLRRVLDAFPAARTRRFFEHLGVALHEEESGKLFPDSHSAHTVLNALVDEARRTGVEIRTTHRVQSISRCVSKTENSRRPCQHFQVVVDRAGPAGPEPRLFHAERVVLATGGRSLPRSGSDGTGYSFATALGHSLVPTTPALAPLLLEGDFHTSLSGVSQPAELTVHASPGKPLRLSGSLLWTHFGISGPVALNASRHWHRPQVQAVAPLADSTAPTGAAAPRVTANFLPGLEFADIEARLLNLAATQRRASLRTRLSLLHPDSTGLKAPAGGPPGLPARFVDALLARLEIPAQTSLAQLEREQRRRLIHALHTFELPVVGSRGYNYAEATAGGVPLTEIDPATMASRRCPGLFLVGEILDVDGRIGGFNFQWAWSSGYVCGSHLAQVAALTS